MGCRTDLSKLGQVDLEGLSIILKTETDHGIQDVLSSYRFPLLHLTFLSRFARNETDEFGDAFLYTFFGLFGDFRGQWDARFHYSRDIRNLQVVVYIEAFSMCVLL